MFGNAGLEFTGFVLREDYRMQNRVQKRMIIAAVVILAVILITAVGTGIFSVKARAEETSYKYYTSIVVKKGDTLWTIANQYITEEYADVEEYIHEVKALNHLESDGIYAGEYLTIPYYSSDIL